MSEPVTRRTFLSNGGKTAVGLTAAAAASAGVYAMLHQPRHPAPSASERLNFALIGCGGMGNADLRSFMESGMANIQALCDIDSSRLNHTAEVVEQQTGKKPQVFSDYRRVLDLKEIDGVIVATPDHWHAIPTIAACAAGKDVYVEKPCCHNIREGRAMVDAAEKFKRVVQVGTQQRSYPHIQSARELIRSGKLGAISMTESYTTGNQAPDGLGNAPDEPVPVGVDYNAWLGPAPVRPFNRRRFHVTFRWYFDYAAGMVGDWNVHLQDICMWTLEQSHCLAVSASGGKLVLTDDRDTPDTMLATYEYGPGQYTPQGHLHLYTMRKASGPPPHCAGYGMVFHGTNGKLHLRRTDWELIGDRKDWDKPDKGLRISSVHQKGFDEHEPHVAHVRNFIECMKSRQKPIAGIADHFNTVTCCHLANISLRCRSKVYWHPERELCFADEALTLPHDAANRLLSREYREGFELPRV